VCDVGFALAKRRTTHLAFMFLLNPPLNGDIGIRRASIESDPCIWRIFMNNVDRLFEYQKVIIILPHTCADQDSVNFISILMLQPIDPLLCRRCR
jgi:hypothetical protein